MRLCSRMFAFSAVLGLAFSAGAQAPATTPPAGGAVELSNTPKDDPAARQMIADAVDALQKMGPTSFKAHAAMAGGPVVMNGNADVRFVRNNAVPQDSLFWAKGRMEMPALTTPDFHVSRWADDKKGKRVSWQDDAAKVVFDRPEGPGPDGKETEGGREMGVVLRSVLMPALVNSAPFSDELKQNRAGDDVVKYPCVFLPDEAVGGEMCKVIRVYIKQGSTERTLWISPKDKLPRKYQQMRSQLTRFWEITDVKPLEGGVDVAKLKTPDGYKFDTSDEGGTVAPKTPVGAAPPMPVVAQPGGPQVGQLAPDFDLKTADGASVSLASLKGQTVVINFGSSRFPQSWSGQAAASKAVEGKAKVVSLACRESDSGKAVKAFADAHGTGQLLLNGDGAAELYRVRGFPSTCVVGPDGKVVAFFESAVTEADLAGAVASK